MENNDSLAAALAIPGAIFTGLAATFTLLAAVESVAPGMSAQASHLFATGAGLGAVCTAVMGGTTVMAIKNLVNPKM